MQKVQILIEELHSSIFSSKVDFQLLEKLKKIIKTAIIQKNNFQQFINFLLQLYQLSNHQKLYKVHRTSITLNEMAIQLKILVCEIMSMLISYFEKEQSGNLIPFQILSEAIQIMIICTRVCLNQGKNNYITEIQQFYKFIHNPYDYVVQSLEINVQFLHQLNSLQLMRFKCESQAFKVLEFHSRLVLPSVFEKFNFEEYKAFQQNIIMQIVLKSLKNGKLTHEKLDMFYPFLSQQSMKQLDSLIFTSANPERSISSRSEFVQIYNQVKNHGFQSIEIEFLEQFIRNENNFNDERIFQIASLTLQPEFLEIWFRIFNTKKQKTISIQKALSCYIYLVDSILNQKSSPNFRTQISLLKLSNAIIFAMLTQKKAPSLNQFIIKIIKTFVKILTNLCFNLYQNWVELKDFGEKIVLICSRYQSLQILKAIYSVMLYYTLVERIKNEDIYQKFIVHHNNDKSSKIYKLLSTVYEFKQKIGENKSAQNLKCDQSLLIQIQKQPFIALLFAQNCEDMTIFKMEMKDFKNVNKKFFVYSEMFKKYQGDENNLCTILQHLQTFIIKVSLQEFNDYLNASQEQIRSIKQLFLLLVNILEKKEAKNLHKGSSSLQNQNNESNRNEMNSQMPYSKVSSNKICFILINLYIMSDEEFTCKFKQSASGVILNKYSMKIRVISELIEMIKNKKLFDQIQLYNLCCCYLITIIQKLKKSFIKNERIGEAGEVSFVHIVEQLIHTYHSIMDFKSHNQQNHLQQRGSPAEKSMKMFSCSALNQWEIKRDFIKFVMFEIDCLTNNHQKYLKVIEQISTTQLKTFINSVHIPKNLKQRILRKIVRQNFIQDSCEITLKQFKEIIEVTEDQEELQLYLKYVYCNFGEEGRKMILLMANQDKRLQKVLLNDSDVEI